MRLDGQAYVSPTTLIVRAAFFGNGLNKDTASGPEPAPKEARSGPRDSLKVKKMQTVL